MQENHSFSSSDTISVFSLVTISLGIISYVFVSWINGSKFDDAYRYATNIAVQLTSGKVAFQSQLKSANDRRLASDSIKIAESGHIGLDPWGRPLSYSLISNESGDKILFVISSGPNQKRETTDEIIKKTIQKSKYKLPLEESDDIVISRSL
jgi:hypothetical protein